MIPSELFRLMPTKRECGECDLCCTAVGVEDMDKPPGVACSKLCGTPGKSCSIYATRPRDCSEFMCLWRSTDDLMPAEMIPASVGFVVAAGGIFGESPPIITVHPDPKRPRAWDVSRNRNVFRELARKFNGLVVIGQGELACHIFTPSGRDYSRAMHPELFKENGKSVGAPSYDFGPTFPTKTELVGLLFGLWE